MNLSYVNLDLSIDITDTSVATLYIERLAYFRLLVQELMDQCNGEGGNWVLGEGSRSFDLKKTVIIESDLFSLDLNSKALQSKLQGQLTNLANEESLLLAEINEKLQEFYLLLEQQMEIEVFHQIGISGQELIKLGNFRVESNRDLLDRLPTYLDLVVDLLGVKLIILVNLRKCLDCDEIKLLYQHCINKKIPLLCIESGLADQSVDKEIEVVYTIDNDWCLI